LIIGSPIAIHIINKGNAKCGVSFDPVTLTFDNQ
jgi:hypothetical protein